MTALATLAELAEELCEPRQHREPVYGWSSSRHRIVVGHHITSQPGLLIQLHEAVIPALESAGDEMGARSVAQSAPPLQLDALNCYLDIRRDAARWVAHFGPKPDLQPEGNIRKLVGLVVGNYPGDVLSDMRRWRGWAATMSGWQTIYTPKAFCPVVECQSRESLRVNLTANTAICVVCRAWWDAATIGILAEHISSEGQPSDVRERVRSSVAGHGGWSSRAAQGASL